MGLQIFWEDGLFPGLYFIMGSGKLKWNAVSEINSRDDLC